MYRIYNPGFYPQFNHHYPAYGYGYGYGYPRYSYPYGNSIVGSQISSVNQSFFNAGVAQGISQVANSYNVGGYHF
jgi:hypothetical protein